MFDTKRLLAIGMHIALICATLLLLGASVSIGQTSEVGGRVTGQVLRQAMGFRAQSLRRPANAQTRGSRLERSDKESNRSSVTFGGSTDSATVHAWHPVLLPKYRTIAPHTPADIELLRTINAVDVERARSPPDLLSAAVWRCAVFQKNALTQSPV